MQLPAKIDIDLLAFFKTGRFDYLRLGQTREWILNNFPDPDDFGGGATVRKATIWRYGNIELHFLGEELALIYSDYIANLDGGQFLRLDKWILADPTRLTLLHCIEHLIKAGIDFSKTTCQVTKQVTLSLQPSRVQLTFAAAEGSDDTNQFLLDAFSLRQQ